VSQQLFDDQEKQEKQVQVKDIEEKGSMLDRLSIPNISFSTPSLPTPDVFDGSGISDRGFLFISVELLLVIYLALGYAGLVPLF
jgi:hypothetical protein